MVIVLHTAQIEIPLAIENKTVTAMYVELKLYNKKWLINCSYNAWKKLIENHFQVVRKLLNIFSTTYD